MVQSIGRPGFGEIDMCRKKKERIINHSKTNNLFFFLYLNSVFFDEGFWSLFCACIRKGMGCYKYTYHTLGVSSHIIHGMILLCCFISALWPWG